MSHSYTVKKFFSLVYKFFISLKLAVFTLSSWAILTGIGTFVESRYDQELANKLVYHSFWMMMVLFLLSLNLIMVLIDRFPWKKRQIGFVLAHIGILILILGSLFTKYLGVDGSLRFKEGEKASSLSVSDMELKVYSSYDGEKFSLIYEKAVEMLFIKPTEKKPYTIQTAGEKFVIDKYIPFAVGREVFKSTDKGSGIALRFHLDGSRANVVEWMKLELGEKTVNKNFGPASITLTIDPNYKAKRDKELVLFVRGDQLFYSLSQQKRQPLKTGMNFATGWMDFQFRLLEFFPKYQREFVFESRDRPSPATIKAIRIRYQEETVWLGQNSYARFFDKDRVYAITYVNKSYNLGFDLELLDFRMTKYQGSGKAKSYESEVRFQNQTQVISMNEPLKYGGWTFYQSSFEEGEEGADPVISILSVNRDPGRWLKYAGSALIVMGIILLFYRRRMNP